MKKQEFVEQLRKHLASLPKADIDDIVRDQEEYISDAVASGRDEEGVVSRIGDPKALAQSLVAQSRVKAAQDSTKLIPKAQHTWAAVVAFIALAPINFILLFPVLGICFAMFGIGFALISVLITIAFRVVFMVPHMLMAASIGSNFTSFFFLLGSLFGFAFLIGVFFVIVRTFLTVILMYIKSNLNLFRNLGDPHV